MAAAEPLILWGAALAVTASVVLAYLRGVVHRERSDRARREEAVRLGIDRPQAQFPFIDPARCMGCGTCVGACPEGDVLGLVGGLAVVVNGMRCIGHGKCADACPVGAIQIGLGDVRARADVPVMDDWHETSVPGLFVAGELGGLALVRNAVAQGRRAVERIAGRRRPAGAPEDLLDVVIVGAGPAGLAATATAHERGLRYVALEREPDLGGAVLHYPRRKLVLVQAMDIPLWGRLKEAEYSKERMLEVFEQVVRRNRLAVRFGEAVHNVAREGGAFAVHTAGAAYRARSVVLALGRRGTPRKLGVPGEELPKVIYRLLDADGYRGQNVLVVGGGDSAVEAALALGRERRNAVTLSYRREKLVRIKKKNEDRFAELAAAGAVRPLFGSQVLEIRPRSVLLEAGDRRVELPNDHVVVAAGGDPPFAFLRQAGIQLGGSGA